MKDKTRIVIADDHPIFRRGLRQVVEAELDLLVVAEAGDGQAALEAIRRMTPDVAVLDVQMPGMTGFQVAQDLGKDRTPTNLVFLTMHSDPAMLERERIRIEGLRADRDRPGRPHGRRGKPVRQPRPVGLSGEPRVPGPGRGGETGLAAGRPE